MRLRPLLAMLAIASLILGACGLGTTGGQELAGTWILAEARSPEGAIELPEDAQVTLEFQEDGQIGGIAACNHYGGEVRVDGGRVSIENISQTEMGCEEPLMSVESAYLSALANVTTLDLGDSLVLSGEGIRLVFDAQPPVPDADLTGTPWRLDTLIEGDTASTPAADARLTLHADGTFVAHTGCRELTGSWSREDDRLRTFDVFHPDLDCVDEGVGRQDDHVTTVLLVDGFTAEVEGERLTLRSDGRGLGFTAEAGGGV